jgi:hypothetical protein
LNATLIFIKVLVQMPCRDNEEKSVMGDPFLNYFALGLLIFVVVVLFYGIIAIHDIPYLIAKGRDHPHQDAIHAAGWVSLFTLHALWPFLWIWAMAYRPERGWGFHHPGSAGEGAAPVNELEELRRRVAQLEASVKGGGR